MKSDIEFLEVFGQHLEVKRVSGIRPDLPTLVLLHEGLGCIAMWRDFPERLAQMTGNPVFAYSRLGYGRSQPCEVPRPLSYMHREGRDVLPEVLRVAGIDNHVLVGHSDGGSIALIHAGGNVDAGLRAVITMAAHVFCEEITVASIAEAKLAYENGRLREGLKKYHGDNTECAFWGWNKAWLDPDFMQWNIEEYLPHITVPTLVIQGLDDQYGTLAQVESIAGSVAGAVETCLLEDCAHSPFKEQQSQTLAAIHKFLTGLQLTQSGL